MAQVFDPKFTREKCLALLQKFDRDGDGSIRLREWLAFFGELLPALPADEARNGIAELRTHTAGLKANGADQSGPRSEVEVGQSVGAAAFASPAMSVSAGAAAITNMP